MILILTPNIDPESSHYGQLMAHLSRLQDITLRVHREVGAEKTLTEIYLIGNTSAIPVEDMKSLPGVERVVRVSEEYLVLGRHRDDYRRAPFRLSGIAVWPGHLACLRWFVRRRYSTACRRDDENAARSWTSMHAYGRLQTAHQSVFISRAR